MKARKRAQRLGDELLPAEAELAAAARRFVTIDGPTVEADLDLYEQALFAFDAEAAARQGHHASTSSRLTFGIRGARLSSASRRCGPGWKELNPAGICGGRRWQIRDSARRPAAAKGSASVRAAIILRDRSGCRYMRPTPKGSIVPVN